MTCCWGFYTIYIQRICISVCRLSFYGMIDNIQFMFWLFISVLSFSSLGDLGNINTDKVNKDTEAVTIKHVFKGDCFKNKFIKQQRGANGQ